jgi:hypothetical protein
MDAQLIDLLQRTLTRITDTAGAGGYRLIGALTARFTAYLDGRLATTREQFIDYCVDMLLSRCRAINRRSGRARCTYRYFCQCMECR